MVGLAFLCFFVVALGKPFAGAGRLGPNFRATQPANIPVLYCLLPEVELHPLNCTHLIRIFSLCSSPSLNVRYLAIISPKTL